MDFRLIIVAILFLGFNEALIGPNVCTEKKNYTLTTRVKYQQPVTIKTYTWCLSIPPRCSSIHTEMREKWKVQTEHRSKILQFCCAGFVEDDENCIPKCPEGLAGDKCNQECPENKWGPSCSMDCTCPYNSDCDSKNGKCVCFDGWVGPNCDVPKDVYMKRLTTHSATTQSKETKVLFDWSTPILVQSTQPSTTVTVPPTLSSTTMTTFGTTQLQSKTTVYVTPKTTTETTTITTTIQTETPTKASTTEKTISSIGVPVTSQIESPITPKSPINSSGEIDSPITVILHGNSKNLKDPKPVSKATERSIISLTVLKSTVTSKRKPIKANRTRPDSGLVKITLNSGLGISGKASMAMAPSTPPTIRRRHSTNPPSTIKFDENPQEMVVFNKAKTKPMTAAPRNKNTTTTEMPSEEIRHVLTEPEQITSVAGDEDEDEKKDDFIYSALSIAMGVVAALILVATVIVLVAKYKRSASTSSRKMEMQHMQSMLNVSEDELPSSYIRSVFHTPDIPINSSFNICEDKSRYRVPFMQPVVIHAVSPIMMENFRDILESHYDHPKPPRPTTFGPAPTKCVTFGSNTEMCFPVTEEAINTLKLEHHHYIQTIEEERIEPVYDEIPWRLTPDRATEILDDGDEAVTEL